VGFTPGGFSLHNMMLPHGPDMPAYESASTVELKPHKMVGTLAFMFETRFPQRVTKFAAGLAGLQPDYIECWTELKRRFDPNKPQAW
jgi:homogentisate 1,2-dioxygenase